VFRPGWLRRDDSPIMEQTGKAIELLELNRIVRLPVCLMKRKSRTNLKEGFTLALEVLKYF
jgi:hypothetical protein